MVELKEKLAAHGVSDLGESAAGSVPDISPEDLGELMGDEQEESGSPADAPGMSIEETGEDEADGDDNDNDSGEDEE